MANGAGNGTGGKKNGLRNGSGIATIEHSENKEKTQKEINIMSEIRKIENFAAPELDVYARLSEPQLLHYYEPQPGLFLAESPRVIERALDAAKAVAIPLDREVIHILPQEYIVDDQRGIADPMGMAGVRLEVKVHIVTGAVTSAQNIVRSCHKSGLDVSDIALESLASAKAVLTEEERELGVALVDIGGGTTDIAIFANDSIKHTGVLALGGQNLTNDIAFGLRTPMAAAEKIKIKHGAAIAEMVRPDEYIEVPSVGGREPRRLSRQVLAEICEPRMEEILTLLDQELVRSGLKNMIGAGVVLTGGTALIQGCQELGEQVFNLPTRIGYPRNVGGLKDMVNSPKFATAMGLLRFGAEKEGMEQKFRIRSDGNVFNSILSRMKKWFSEIS